MAQKTPATTAARKYESRHDQWWYPARCEKPGCSESSKESLKKCSACYMVQYCCKQHQAEDWGEHKAECKLFQSLGLRSTFYTDEDILQHFPLKPPPVMNSTRRVQAPQGSSCALCGKDDTMEEMTITHCCEQNICNNAHKYQLMSFSREYCLRSHDRYTLCGYHGVDELCDKTKDWRECPGCTKKGDKPEDVSDMLWRGLNSYNFYPLLSKDVPRHARCETCSNCHRKMLMGVQGGTRSHSRGLICTACSPAW